MPMEIDRKELKSRAREAMSLSKPSFWLVTLVYILMTTGVSALANFSYGSLAVFLSIAITLYSWVVAFSYRLWALWTCRRLEPGLGSLMEGFSVAGRVIVMEILLMLRLLGWTFLLSLAAGFLSMIFPSAAFTVIVVVAAVVAAQIIILRYALAHYVLADYPDLGPSVAVAHSVRLTRGWILELLKLHLSFIGWYVLSYLLAAVGIAIGLLISGDMGALAGLPFDQILDMLPALAASPIPSLAGNLVTLPLLLYFTPYLEVTLAEFYNARISLSDNMADPLGNMQMPPV